MWYEYHTFHYPTPDDIDTTVNEDDTDKMFVYRFDYNHRPSNTISFTSVVVRPSDHLHCDLVRIFLW
jgi:hypothetical protein